MKITKEILVGLRDKTTSPVSMCFGSATITPDELRALLDERKALRAELRAVYSAPSPGDRFSLALALGEDEE